MSRRTEGTRCRWAEQFICSSAHLLIGSSFLACGRQINFLDPAGPRFEGRYAPPAPATSPAELRVITFNVKYAQQVERAIEVLRESDSLRGADIIALQEMNDGATDRMARALRMNYAYLPATISPITDTFFGPAVLSRWPIDSAWKVLLPHGSVFRGQRRTATGAIIRYGERRVRVYSVHLETQASIAPRRAGGSGARRSFAMRQSAREPVILAGDFNSYGIGDWFERRGFRWLTEVVRGDDPALELGPSPGARLPAGADRSVGVERDARGASDHRPVWAVLRMSG